MGQFSAYPAAVEADYVNATTFLIQNADGDTRLGNLELLKSAFLCDIRCAYITIPTAEVLTLNTTPVEIVPAPGVGYAIEVISVSMKMVFVSAAYAANTTLQAITSGATVSQFEGNVLDASVSKQAKLSLVEASGATSTQIIENAAVNMKAKTGDPTTGDSDIQVFVLYRILAV